MSSNHWTRASGPSKPFNGPSLVFDIESWGLFASKSAFGCSRNIETGEERVFDDMQEARQYFEDQAPCIVYAHNNFGFDIWSILDLETVHNSPKMASGTNIYEIRHNKVRYRDSKNLFPGMRLSELGDALRMPKGETPIDFIKGNVREINELDIEYCLRDCRILGEAIKQLHDFYAENVGETRFSTALPLTIASISYRMWCHNFWPKEWSWIDRKTGKEVRAVKCDRYFNDTARDGFKGGKTLLINTEPGAVVHGILEYDVNALYPFTMSHPNNLFPDPSKCWKVGPTKSALLNLIDSPEYVCWARVDMHAPEGVERFLPVLDDNKRLIFDRETFSGWLMEPELRMALKEGWVIDEIYELNKSRGIRPFREYINWLYELRKEYKKNNDPREFNVKIAMNSLYGRFSLSPKPRRIENPEQIAKAQDRPDFHERYELRFYDQANLRYPYLLDFGSMSGSNTSQWYGFSSFITSYARTVLSTAIIVAGENAIYSDTDSIHLRVEGREDFEKRISVGDEIGQWKLETPDPIHHAVYWRKKAYTWYNADGTKRKVKAKGVQVKNDDGQYIENAGDMRKLQHSRTTVKLYSALRRNLNPGDQIITEKRDSLYYEGD